ncbi:MAG TPA: hypothetical protein PLW02_02430 [Verrucomicrobiota bacterium]|nr:hypothetical protein [Verrucomicrobiota bacterium]
MSNNSPTNNPYVTEVTDYKKPLELPELRLGPVNFYPRLGFQSMYDDNINTSTRNEQSDFIWTVLPGIFTVAGDKDYAISTRIAGRTVGPPRTSIITDSKYWPGITAYVDYGARVNQYTSHTDQNYTDHIVNGYFFIPFTKSLLEFSQGYSQINTEILEAGERSPQIIYNTALKYGIQLSGKTSLESKFSRISTDYENRKDFSSYVDYSIQNWLNWQYSQKLNLSAGVIAGMYDIEKQPNQTYEQFRARARYYIFERLWIDGSVGMQLRQFDTDRSSTTEPVFTLSASYSPRDRTVISLSASRQEYASVYSGYNYLSTSIGANVYQQIGKRYTAIIGGGFSRYDYIATFTGKSLDRSDDYFYTGLSFKARITKHLDGSFFYTYRQENYYNGATYANNQVGIQFMFNY